MTIIHDKYMGAKMNFDILDDNEKRRRHNELLACVNSYGGANYFLQLVEALRATKPHPLINKNREFYFALGGVKWNKVIFKDKLTLLLDARQHESKNNNLLPPKEDKNYKKVLNLVRALGSVEFVVKPKNIKHGDGFSLRPFDVISDDVTKLNPIFDNLFFSSVNTIKKVLSYEPRNEEA